MGFLKDIFIENINEIESKKNCHWVNRFHTMEIKLDRDIKLWLNTVWKEINKFEECYLVKYFDRRDYKYKQHKEYEIKGFVNQKENIVIIWETKTYELKDPENWEKGTYISGGYICGKRKSDDKEYDIPSYIKYADDDR